MDLEDVAKEVLASGLSEEVQLMKKKIQLSEGQRRAEYEEFDAEKKRLTGRIRKLKKDLKEAGTSRPSKHVEAELLKRSGKPLKELKPYLGKTHEEVEQILDLQCIDLKKKLDLLKYEIAKKSERLDSCMKEMKELKSENETETLILIQPSASRVTKLENKIHETSLHLQEMRHMEKKYSKMRQSLLDDRVFFQSTLDNYEEEIAKQGKEIHHLQGVRDEAVRLRDKTKRKLSRLESLVVAQGIEREQELRDLKRKVEEGRQSLERVERSLVPSGGKGLQGQDSGDFGDTGLSTEQLAKEALLEKLSKIKEVTGAKDEADILQKLRSQRETKHRLLKLKVSIENEKKKMELKKEQLEAELEAVKFSEVKDNEQNEEEIEILEREISKADEEVNEQSVLLDCEKAELKELKQFIGHLIHLLKLMQGEESSKFVNRKQEENCSELIDQLKIRFNSMMTYIKNTGNKAVIEAGLIDELFVKELDALEISSKKHEGDSDKPAEEIPDVPTRDYLKRQSQIIVEAQGKRKGAYPKDNAPQSYRV